MFSVPSLAVVEGLAFGITYGLLAMGLVLIYRSSRVLNFAQGQIGVVGGVLLAKLAVEFHLPYAFALVCGVAAAVLVGGGSELLLRRLYTRPRLLVMVGTIGLSQLLFVVGRIPFIGPKSLVLFPVPLHWTFSVSGLRLDPAVPFTLLVGPLVALALALFFKLSPYGLHMRAVAENSDSARLSGIYVRRTSTLAWMLAGALSAFTAILIQPLQQSAATIPLAPGTLLRALAAALVAGMVSLPAAFAAGIGIGVFEQIGYANSHGLQSRVEVEIFLLLLVVLSFGARRARRSGREDASTFSIAGRAREILTDSVRRSVGRVGVGLGVAAVLLLPLGATPGRMLLVGRILVFALIAVSLTILSGWAGQVSLGHMALVGVGVLFTVHLSASVPILLLMPLAGAAGAVVALVIGIPALRVPGLYLAVTTLGLALVMQTFVLRTPCTKLPLVHARFCTGLPQPSGTLVHRPALFGLSLASNTAVYYFTFAVLVLALAATIAWRDRGLGRVLIAVRDNETAAAAMGVRVVRAKLTAFALSGFLAGVAGVCFALVQGRVAIDRQLDAPQSVLLVTMVVIGGLGSISGAILGAVYLIGLPAAFGSTPTVQFLTSGVGLLAFLLYLPGGLAQLLSRFADSLAAGIRRLDQPRGLPDDELTEPVGEPAHEPIGAAP